MKKKHKKSDTGSKINRLAEKVDTLSQKFEEKTEELSTKFDEKTEELSTKFDEKTEELSTKFNKLSAKFDKQAEKILTGVDEKIEDLAAMVQEGFLEVGQRVDSLEERTCRVETSLVGLKYDFVEFKVALQNFVPRPEHRQLEKRVATLENHAGIN